MGKRAFITPPSIPAQTIARVLLMPDSDECVALVLGALSLLTEPENWQQTTGASPEDTAQLFDDMWRAFNGE